MNIAIIGSGNVATVLGKKIALAGHAIVQVTGRSEAHAKELAAKLDCDYSTDYSKINMQADLYGGTRDWRTGRCASAARGDGSDLPAGIGG